MYEVDEYTVSLLHFDDGIKDETGKVWTAHKSAAVSTADSNFGGSSLYLNGAQYLSSPNNGDFSFGSGAFTVECWVKRNSYSKINQALFEVVSDNGNTGNHVGYGAFLILGANLKGLFGFYNNNSTISVAVAGTTVIPVGEWTHIAGVRHNNTLYLFKNGVLENTVDCTGFSVNPNSATLANIGSYANDAWGNAYSGYIDELRVSNIARWTADFSLKSPTNLVATAGDSQITLTWTTVDGAKNYIVKRSTTSGGTYTTISSSVSGTSYVDSSVTNGTTYYYVVTALNTYGESVNSNEASATPVATVVAPTGNALLRVTMLDSSERDYQLTTTEIDGFVNWFNSHTSTNTTSYMLNKKVGTQNSKEYLTFDKIISFEVMEL